MGFYDETEIGIKNNIKCHKNKSHLSKNKSYVLIMLVVWLVGLPLTWHLFGYWFFDIKDGFLLYYSISKEPLEEIPGIVESPILKFFLSTRFLCLLFTIYIIYMSIVLLALDEETLDKLK